MNDNNLYQKIESLETKISQLENQKGIKGFFKQFFSKINMAISIGLTVFVSSLVVYAAQTVFVNGTVISATDVNANFTELYNKVNDFSANIAELYNNDDDININIADLYNNDDDININITELYNNDDDHDANITVLYNIVDKEYIKLTISGNESVDTLDTVGFDVVEVNHNMTALNDGVTLKAGKTYRIESRLNLQNPPNDTYLGYRFYHDNTAFGEAAYSNSPDGDPAKGVYAGLLEIYTPNTDQLLTVKITDDNLGSGLVAAQYNTYLIVTEL